MIRLENAVCAAGTRNRLLEANGRHLRIENATFVAELRRSLLEVSRQQLSTIRVKNQLFGAARKGVLTVTAIAHNFNQSRACHLVYEGLRNPQNVKLQRFERP